MEGLDDALKGPDSGHAGTASQTRTTRSVERTDDLHVLAEYGSESEIPGEWKREHVRERKKNRSSSRSSRSRSINLNTDLDHAGAGIIHPISQYHEKSMEQVVVFLALTSLTVGLMNSLGLNIGWSVATVGIAAFAIRRRTEGIKDDFLTHMDSRRLEAFQSPQSAGESAEFINAILKKIWPILNTDLFGALMDLLEDTIKQEAPSFITSVRIEDLDLGSNAWRILSVKVLPDNIEIGGAGRPDEGEFITLEVEFSHRRLPPPAAEGSNTHFMVYFGIGPKKLAHLEIPVLVELRGAIGRLRLRIQLISDPPFIRQTVLSFPYLPNVSVVARPLKSALDVMNVPLLSHYIQKSIREVLKSFTSPAWYSLDCSRLLVGSEVNLTPLSIGVVCVIVHSVSEVHSQTEKATTFGRYVTVGLARFGKPLYSTRVITNEPNRNYLFEETCFLRITPDEVEHDDRVQFTVWDSAKHHTEDAVGRAQIPLDKLLKYPNHFDRHRQPIASLHRLHDMTGEIEVSVAFFTLAKATAHHGGIHKGSKSTGSASHTKESVVLNKGEAMVSRAGLYSDRIRDALHSLAAPNPELKAGVLALQLHQLTNLEVPAVRGSIATGKKRDSGTPPSSYCQVFVNDEKVYQSRLKKFSATPFINASFEVFCGDWTTARVAVVVLESHEREPDTVVGTVTATVMHLLQGRTQKTMLHPLIGGTGYGRLRMSVLFKSINMAILPAACSWNIGTLVITKLRVRPALDGGHEGVVVRVGSAVISTAHRTSSSWQADEPEAGHFKHSDYPLKVPVIRRHQAAVVFEVPGSCKSGHGHPQTDRQPASEEAVFWLSGLNDDEAVSVSLALAPSDFDVRQNNLSTLSVVPGRGDGHLRRKSGLGDSRSGDAPHTSFAAQYLDVEMHFVPGVSALHRELVGAENVDLEDVLRAWEHSSQKDDRSRNNKVNFLTPAPGQDRTPTASQSNSRRSSWTSVGESSGWSSDNVDGKNQEKKGAGWLKRRMEKHQRSASDPNRDKSLEEKKTSRSFKWMKDSGRRLSKMSNSDKNLATIGSVLSTSTAARPSSSTSDQVDPLLSQRT